MKREIKSELLDELPPSDPRAIHSRRDLQRVNTWMRNRQIMENALSICLNGKGPDELIELGAGDGTFLLEVARRMARNYPAVSVLLLDKNNVVRPETRNRFRSLGWDVQILVSDVREWLRQPAASAGDIIIANLFLHHFSDALLQQLFGQIARRSRAFIAVEPRRWAWSLVFANLLGLIGCNEVTRHDALVSIRAGFAGQELSKLWPETSGWILDEHPANFASHLFVARRA